MRFESEKNLLRFNPEEAFKLLSKTNIFKEAKIFRIDFSLETMKLWLITSILTLKTKKH